MGQNIDSSVTQFANMLAELGIITSGWTLRIHTRANALRFISAIEQQGGSVEFVGLPVETKGFVEEHVICDGVDFTIEYPTR